MVEAVGGAAVSGLLWLAAIAQRPLPFTGRLLRVGQRERTTAIQLHTLAPIGRHPILPARRRVAEQLPERLPVVVDPARGRQFPVLVDDRDLRASAVQVDADAARRVTRGRSSLELSGLAGAIRAVSNRALRGGGPTSCPPDRRTSPGPAGTGLRHLHAQATAPAAHQPLKDLNH